MQGVKLIACLANSRKHSGRCVAGIDLASRGRRVWVRPVSSTVEGEVSESERQYADGSDPQVLDVIEVPLLGPAPAGYQVENWLLDPDSYWVRRGRLTWDELADIEDVSGPLWPGDAPATFHGMNDRVTADRANDYDYSLRLVHVDDLMIRVFSPGIRFGDHKRRVQGRFSYLGTHYALSVTDPVIERRYLAQPDGDYRIGDCYLTLSLGERFHGYCYKLVAAVIDRQRAEEGD